MLPRLFNMLKARTHKVYEAFIFKMIYFNLENSRNKLLLTRRSWSPPMSASFQAICVASPHCYKDN